MLLEIRDFVLLPQLRSSAKGWGACNLGHGFNPCIIFYFFWQGKRFRKFPLFDHIITASLSPALGEVSLIFKWTRVGGGIILEFPRMRLVLRLAPDGFLHHKQKIIRKFLLDDTQQKRSVISTVAWHFSANSNKHIIINLSCKRYMCIYWQS